MNKNLKKKNIFLEEENFDILTLLQKNQSQQQKEKIEIKEAEFQMPMSIMKSKPLKSEKDRIIASKTNQVVK